jgi:hypothetical protein
LTQGRKTGGRDFKPGESGNPNGRPPLPVWMREVRNKSEKEFIELLHRFGSLTTADLREVSKNEELPVEHMMFVQWLIAAFTDENARRSYMDRRYGKVQEKIKHEGLAPTFVIRKRDGDTVEMGIKSKDEDE